MIPGAIYEVTTENDGETTTIYTSTLKYIGFHANTELVRKIRADQLMFDEREREKKFAIKQSVISLPDEWKEIVRFITRPIMATRKDLKI